MYRRDNAIYKDVLCFLLSYQTSISGNSIANITLQAVTCQVIRFCADCWPEYNLKCKCDSHSICMFASSNSEKTFL